MSEAPRKLGPGRGARVRGNKTKTLQSVLFLCTPSKVLPDLNLQLDPLDKASLGEREEWQELALAFLDDRSREDAAGKRPRRLLRVCGLHFLNALDDALNVATGAGLSAYCVGDEQKKSDIAQTLALMVGQPHVPAPVLTVCVDQGGGSFNALWYLMYRMHCRLVVLSDISHRVWNDTKSAIVQAGLWSHVLLHSIVLNADYGPWSGSAFFNEQQTALAELRTSSNSSNALFQFFFRRLLQDKDELDRVGEPGVEEQVWREFCDSERWQHKTTRVSLNLPFCCYCLCATTSLDKGLLLGNAPWERASCPQALHCH